MGWAYGVYNGREVGYSVEAECDHPECDEMIDRGLSYACGGWPDENEFGCGLHFCSDHQTWPDLEDYDGPFVCLACARILEEEAAKDAGQARNASK